MQNLYNGTLATSNLYGFGPFRLQFPLYETPGGGSGGGSAAGGASNAGGSGSASGGRSSGDSGGGGGTAAGSRGTGSGAGGAGSGGSAAVALNASTIIDLGNGETASWGDLINGENARYIPRERWDRGVDELMQLGDQMDRDHQQRSRQQQRPQQQRQQRPDPIAEIENLGVVDGRSAAKLARALQEANNPLASLVGQMAQRLVGLERHVTTISAPVSAYAEQQAERAHLDMLTGEVGKLGEIPGFHAPITADIAKAHPVLVDIARDLYDSYDAKTWGRGDFGKFLRQRLEGLAGLQKALAEANVVNAREKQRQFFNPGKGNGRGTGGGAYKFESGADLAARARESGMFG